ncbi:hypothetical protein ACT4S2_11465 [Kocuria turfanensis]|uniref:hypothetical protein n=1 Tax=Kocuria turfanensis TaxID=388357 RepID=UPI00403504E2
MLEIRGAAQNRATAEPRRSTEPVARERSAVAVPVALVVLGAALVLGASLGGPTWSGVLRDAGVVLLTVGGVGLLLVAAPARRSTAVPAEAPARPAAEPVVPRGDQLGLVGVREELDVVDVLRSVRPGQELWWMDTFPLTLAGDLDAIHRALRAGVRVRLLVLDPRSPALAARLREIRHHYGLSPMDLRRSFDTLVHQLRALGETDPVVAERLAVRVHDGLPGAPLFLVLGESAPAEGPAAEAGAAPEQVPARPEVVRAFTSYYLLDASQDMPYLEWREGPFAERLHDYARHHWTEGHMVFPLEPGDRSASAFNVRTEHVPRNGRSADGS